MMENDFDYDAMEESLNQEIKNKNEFVTACPHELLDIIRSLRTAEQERDQYKAELLKSKFEAESLAMAIYRGQYATEAPNFELFNNVTGVISQIDNMYAGLISELESLRAKIKEAQEQEPVAEVYKSAMTGTGIDIALTGIVPDGVTKLYAAPIIPD